MSKNHRFYMLILSFILCLSAAAYGQETSGEIQGTVKDPAGAVVPNVTIAVKGVDVGVNRTVQTDAEGFYRIRQLPPGTYNLTTASSSGFAAQSKEGVQVALGNATTVDFQVAPTAGSVTVDVTTEPGVVVDATETKAQDNISQREIERLPKGTGFTSLLKTTSSVRAEPLSGQFSINGSTGPENSFIIDGQEVQNFRTGQINANNDIPYQSVQEIQVKTSGFEAEFGGATGGVINAVTKSGSNDFHGEFGIQFSTQKLNATPRGIYNVFTNSAGVPGGLANSGQGIEFFPVTKDVGTSVFPTAMFSGPVIKNRLWFFAIHNPRIINTERPTTFVSGFGPTRAIGSTESSRQRTTYNYDQIRLDASPFNSLRLSSSFTWNPIVDEGGLLSSTYTTAFRAATSGQNFVIGAPETLTVDGQTYSGAAAQAFKGGRQNSNSVRFEGVWTPTSKLVILGRYTRGFLNEKLASYGIPSTPEFRCQQVPAQYLAVSGCGVQGFRTAANSQTYKDISVRTTIDANVSYLFTALGHHEVKGGYQRSEILNDVLSGNVGPGRTYLYYGQNCFDPSFTYVQWHISPGTYPCPANSIGTGVTYQFGTVGRATNTADTFFVQDKWQPTTRLTFNLGLRTEQERLPAFNANAVPLKFGFGDKLAPRLGVAYALTGDGKTKISAFYGRFFDRLKFALPRGSFGGDFYHVSYFYITADRPAYTNYSVQQLAGSYNFPGGGQCPITSGSQFVCDQDNRIPSNSQGADIFETGQVDPNVKPYRQSEATVEFQREVMRATVLTARYLWRNLDQVIEDIGVPTTSGSEAYVIGNPGQGLAAQVYQQLGYNKVPKAVRNYKAFQAELDSRYVHNFNLNVNYTWSRLWGNYSGLASPDELTAVATGLGRTTPNVNRDFDEPWVGFTASGQEAIGLLPLDRTHVFKASGTYSFDWWGSKSNITDASFFTTAQSGTPVTTFVNIMGIPIPQTKRGDLGRTEAFTQTDLNFTHRYKFGRDQRLTLAFDLNIINVFNENNVIAVNQNLHSANFNLSASRINGCATVVCATNYLTSNGVISQYAAAEQSYAPTPGVVFGVNAARNIAFGQPYVLQEPRSIRFGFRLLF